MTESFLHYLFDNRKLGKSFVTNKGEEIDVVEFGELNVNSGPDFLQSKIIFDGKTWAGNIEFHLNSSDWYRHGHQNDTAYNNVIAHFVLNHDREVLINQFQLPVVELKEIIDPSEFAKFEKIQKTKGWIPCQNSIDKVSNSSISNQLEKVILERLNRKSIEILTLLEGNMYGQEAIFYQVLGKAFGSKVNQKAFLSLTEKLYIDHVKSLQNEPEKIQALLHGCSGLLENSKIEDEYVSKLKSNYLSFRSTNGLKKMASCEWKFSSMRPSNSPSVRIAQFAAVLSKPLVFSRIDDMTLSNWIDYLDVKLDPFWNSHYNFQNRCKLKSPSLTINFKRLLITNAIVPYYFAIGRFLGDEYLIQKAIDFLKEMPSEKNTIISKWGSLGINSTSSYQTQALIEQKNEYCNRKKCLFCNIGKKIIE